MGRNGAQSAAKVNRHLMAHEPCAVCRKQVNVAKASRSMCGCQYFCHTRCILDYSAPIVGVVNPPFIKCLMCRRRTGLVHNPAELTKYLNKLPIALERDAPTDTFAARLNSLDIFLPSYPTTFSLQPYSLEDLPPLPEVRLK